MHESAVEDGSKVVVGATSVEQVAHVREVAPEQAQWQIGGYPLRSLGQVSLGSVRLANECFVCQVAQIRHGGNQFFKPPGNGEVPGKMIPQIGFIVRQIRPTREGVGSASPTAFCR